ncbi:MAG: hypothetical protein M1819_006144 [Sarea resinae]|nr:MAG: hypothetical protein M1819_006144 [Sarea resinae]
MNVILLGHSMGGILSAEVVLLPPDALSTGQPLRHRILGTINFDTPFLGMHPGVVWSGIGSIFRPAPEPPRNPDGFLEAENSTASSLYEVQSPSPGIGSMDSSTYDLPRPSLGSSHSGLSSLSPGYDPNYNPPFPNDLHTPERTGWDSVLHFVTKHSDGLTRATKQYVVSHLEFGGCLADYKGLQTRYSRIRALEDVKAAEQGGPRSRRRVRFVNYYTASSGRPKKIDPPKPRTEEAEGDAQTQDAAERVHEQVENLSLVEDEEHSQSHAKNEEKMNDDHTVLDEGNHTENHEEDAEPELDPSEPASHEPASHEPGQTQEFVQLDPTPVEEEDEEPYTEVEAENNSPEPTRPAPSSEAASIADTFPPILPMPEEPDVFDPSIYPDKDILKVAEKEHKRVVKAYTQAVKNREKSIRDREKLVSKRDKEARKGRERRQKDEEKSAREKERGAKREQEKQQSAAERLHQQNRLTEAMAEPSPLQGQAAPDGTAASRSHPQDDVSVPVPVSSSPPTLPPRPTADPAPTAKPKRDRKFCITPSKSNGNRDPTWIRVYMDGVDEVGAHCGLFFPSATYEKLVTDVTERIEGWVREGMGGGLLR